MAERFSLDKYQFVITPQKNLFIFTDGLEITEPSELVINILHSDGNSTRLLWENIEVISTDKVASELETLSDIEDSATEKDISLIVKGRSEGNFWFRGYILLNKEKSSCMFKIIIKNEGHPQAIQVETSLNIYDTGIPRWLAPGFFYKHNRIEKCTRLYPCYSPDEYNPDKFISNYWAFRSDKLSSPMIFAWRDHISAFISAPNEIKNDMTGFFLRSDRGPSEIGFCFPYREEPVKYSFCHPNKTSMDVHWFTIQESEELEISFEAGISKRDLHYYAPIIRSCYMKNIKTNPTNPWMGYDIAVQLTAFGLYEWHYDDEQRVLYETCSFDKYFGLKGRYINRPHMHVGWVSGAACAFALLLHGVSTNIQTFIDAGTKILDHISEALTPCGTFFGNWTEEAGWQTGWNPEEHWIQGRTIAEATLFMLRASRFEMKNDRPHPNWIRAVKSNLDYIVAIQREDGNFGSYFDCETGRVEEWDGAGSLLWIAPLVAGAQMFQQPRYRNAAIKAGEYYSNFIEDEFIYGAPEDIHLSPSSEDGYNALLSYIILYEMNPNEKWLNLAKKAADYLLSFRFSYNVKFSPLTILGMYNFKTQGGDVASVANTCLHIYGLIMHPEILKLSYYLGDPYYEQRAKDHLQFALQFIAREDGDFGARKGMMSEQYYHTDWWQPKGHLLALSHAWCLAFIIYAIYAEKKFDEFKKAIESERKDITLY